MTDHLGYETAEAIAEQTLAAHPEAWPAPPATTPTVHDHLPHVSGTWPHWYVECRVDGFHAHWMTWDPVRGIRDTEHIDLTEEAAWSWLESAEQVIG